MNFAHEVAALQPEAASSKCRVSCPADVRNSAQRVRAREPAAVAAQPLRVLLADDDRDGAMTLATLLELEGYEVRTVHGGQEALDAAREFRPDVCLLDIGMPKITGYEAARRLRQRYGDDCPVLIAVTGWKQASDRILATLAGFDHHVAKPYEPSSSSSCWRSYGPELAEDFSAVPACSASARTASPGPRACASRLVIRGER